MPKEDKSLPNHFDLRKWGKPIITQPAKQPKHVTIIMPYYDNPEMLSNQLDTIACYGRGYSDDDYILPFIEYIVVDDCSPKYPAEDVFKKQKSFLAAQRLDYRLYRTSVDVRWNWLFCRNLGAQESKYKWIVMTDIDHYIPKDTMKNLVYHEHCNKSAYRFSRKDYPELTPYKPHPNSWFMSRSLFLDKVGGYDERFSGYYGSDGEFRDRVKTKTKETYLLYDHLSRVPREIVPDASTTTYERKAEQDHLNIPRIRAEIEASQDKTPKRLTFPWQRIL
mgnify:CR=1 FL=1